MGYNSYIDSVKFESDFSNSTLTKEDLAPYISENSGRVSVLYYYLDIRVRTEDDNSLVKEMRIGTVREEGKFYDPAEEFQEFRELLMSKNVTFNLEVIVVGEDFLDAVKYIINNDGVFCVQGVLAFPGELEKLR